MMNFSFQRNVRIVDTNNSVIYYLKVFIVEDLDVKIFCLFVCFFKLLGIWKNFLVYLCVLSCCI